jgi:hypothetical protein
MMVLIFVTPGSQRQRLVRSNRSAEPVANDERDRDQELSAASTTEAALSGVPDPSVLDLAANELTVDPANSSRDPIGGGAGKQWRGRTRARRTSKPAALAAAVVPPVAWIRVGPGKFVRADSTTDGIAQVLLGTQLDVPVESENRTADSTAPTSPAGTETAETVVEQPNCIPLHSAESNPDDVVGSHHHVLGLTTEVHGIAPTTLGPAPPSGDAIDCMVDAVPLALDEPTLELIPAASFNGKLPDCSAGSERPRSQVQRARSTARWVLRGFTSTIPAPQRACWRCGVGSGRKPRTSVWSSVGANRRTQQLARRAFGRVIRLQRAQLPRSPPSADVRQGNS